MKYKTKNRRNIEKHAARREGATPRSIAGEVKRFEAKWDEAAAQRIPKKIDIAIEWKRSRMWGSNPHCTARVYYDPGFESFETTCGGCGYDKESTVIASALNKCMLGVVVANLGRLSRMKDIPYGLRLDPEGVWTPRFEGGVGMSCYLDRNFEFGDPGILQALNWSMRRTASGKTFDAYELAPKRWRKKKAKG